MWPPEIFSQSPWRLRLFSFMIWMLRPHLCRMDFVSWALSLSFAERKLRFGIDLGFQQRPWRQTESIACSNGAVLTCFWNVLNMIIISHHSNPTNVLKLARLGTHTHTHGNVPKPSKTWSILYLIWVDEHPFANYFGVLSHSHMVIISKSSDSNCTPKVSDK